jgi:hypothetical protein
MDLTIFEVSTKVYYMGQVTVFQLLKVIFDMLAPLQKLKKKSV